MTKNDKETILIALKVYRGDDLERATSAFRGSDLTQQYGESGNTRQQILDNYRKHVTKVESAIRAVEAAPYDS